MTERVTWRDGAIWQFDESRRQEELVPPHQRFTSLFHPPSRFVETRSNRHRRALHPDDARAFQNAPLVGVQPLDLSLDQLAHVFGNHTFNAGGVLLQRPGSIGLDDDRLVNEVFDEVHHEQWVAFGAAVNQTRETASWKPVVGRTVHRDTGR